MNQGFDISIIIPVFNGAAYLKKCFETLQKQNSKLLSIRYYLSTMPQLTKA